MPQKEATNIIIALENEGWESDKIVNFIKFIETHTPSETEAKSDQYDFASKKSR